MISPLPLRSVHTASRAVSAAARSVGHGFGRSASSAARASAGGRSLATGCGRSALSAAVVTTISGRFSRTARSPRLSMVARLRGQSLAAAQPSSTISTTGPWPAKPPSALISGWAQPRMRASTSARRRTRSHQGVRAVLCSLEASSARKAKGGKRTRRGAGGVILSSHHSAGRLASATSAQGMAKVMGPSVSTRLYPPLADSAMNSASSGGSGG